MIDSKYKHWNIQQLIIAHLFAAILILTWLLPYTHHLWDLIDIGTFQILNHNLEGHPKIQIFAALTNHRLFDIITASIMFLPIYLYMKKEKGTCFNKHFSTFFAFALYSTITMITVRFFINSILDIHRLSPSHLQDYVIRLSAALPRLHIRDASSNSFPGDHTAVLFLWTGFLWHIGSWRYGIPAMLFAIIASLPRLVGGAHWLSDDVIGGGIMAAIILSWGYGTPLVHIIYETIAPFTATFTKSYFGYNRLES